MRRNLDRRVELPLPVRDEGAARAADADARDALRGHRHAWKPRIDGGYERVTAKRGQTPKSAQQSFTVEALARAETPRARRLSTFRPTGPGMAPGLQR